MQLLLSAAALARVSDRIAPLLPKLDIVTVTPEGQFIRDGAPAPADQADPEAVWVSLDTFGTPVAPALFGRILGGSKAQWVQVPNAGLDNPIFKNVMAKGVRITKSTAQAPAIAEYVIAHGFSLLHPIDEAKTAQAAHEWRRLSFREIGQSHWTIVGFGAIGQAIAARLAPFGAAVTAVRRSPGPDPLAQAVVHPRDLLTILPDSDVVVLACPLTAETRGMADAAFFAALKPGAILINIGRGELVDEDALRAGLDADRPAHAVLDVFHTEPLPADAWFWDHPKVRVTAHTSNAGHGLVGRGDMQFVDNLGRFLSGQPLLNEAHPSEVGL